MHFDLKLRFLKVLVNVPMRVLDKLIKMPDSANYPQTQMLLRAYAKMAKAYKLDCVNGTFGRAPDGNFERLLRVSVKVLACVSENDRYYRAWLGLAFILAQEEMSEFNEEVAEIKRLIKVQWLDDLGFLSDQVIIHDRRAFLEIALCDYLGNLARMELSECSLPRIVKKK
jgi:hypothetical protein